jgi:hypothetical protein
VWALDRYIRNLPIAHDAALEKSNQPFTAGVLQSHHQPGHTEAEYRRESAAVCRRLVHVVERAAIMRKRNCNELKSVYVITERIPSRSAWREARRQSVVDGPS